MAGNKQQMIFEITGDESGLQKSLKSAGNGLADFGDRAGGVFGGISGGLSTMATGLGGVGNAATLAITAITALTTYTIGLANEINALTRTTGLSAEQLQQWSGAFKTIGLSMEEVGSINEAVMDQLGIASADGSGVGADLKTFGVDVNSLIPTLKQADGGLQALSKVFFDMKKNGANLAEITNMINALGGDAAKLIPTFNSFNSEIEFNNSLAAQNVAMTNEQAKTFDLLSQNTSGLGSGLKTLAFEIVTPLIDIFNGLVKACKEIYQWFDNLKTKAVEFINSFFNWDSNNTIIQSLYDQVIKFYDMIRNVGSKIGLELPEFTPEQIAKGRKHVQTAADAVFSPLGPGIGGLAALARGYSQEDYKPTTKAYTGTTKERSNFDDGKAGEEAKKASDKAAKDRIQAAKVLEQTMNGIAGNGAALQLQQFNKTQDEIEQRIKTSATTLGKTEAEKTELLRKQTDSRKRLYKEMVDSMLTESDPLKLAQNISAIGGSMSGKDLNSVLAGQNERMGLNQDPFNMSADQNMLDTLATEGQAELALNQSLYEQKLLSYQDYQDRMVAIQQSTTDKMSQANIDAQQKTLSMYATGAQDLGTTLAGVFGESNAMAKAAFAMSKGIAVAQSIINIQQGISEAMKLGWPMGIPAGLKVAAEGANIVSTIKGTKIEGQAHDGWDSLPKTGTYNLEKGERVVGKSLNQDLTQYLNNKGGDKGGDIKIDAPLIIQGAGELTDSKFQSMCDKHADTITQAVRKSQQRNV